MNELQSWLSRLEQLHPTEIELGLTRVAEVARRLKVEKPAPQAVTVAGTNGKGSCIATMEALLLAGGYSVGAYSSPHLLRFNERVRINGVEATDADLVRAFEVVEAARCTPNPVSLTYFEYTTLAAFWLFREAGVEFALLEVGLGGRLDAVNLVDADIAVITSVAVDHEAWLGSDRETIGREKAGILRAGAPFICADPEPPLSVSSAAANLGCPSYFIGREFVLGNHSYTFAEQQIALPHSQLPRPSIAAGITALILAGVLPQSGVEQVLAELKLAGRCQAVRWRGHNLLLDVGHNPAAALYLQRWLEANPVQGETHALVAAMADKDLPGLLAPLAQVVSRWYPAQLPQNPRAAGGDLLLAALETAGIADTRIESTVRSITEALPAAVGNLRQQDRLLVFGSFFTVAEVLQYIRENGDGG